MIALPKIEELRENAINNAMRLAESGFYVFPVKLYNLRQKPTGGIKAKKMPRVKWATEATNDPDAARAMFVDYPGSLVGIATGPSKIIVVDLDVNETVNGRASVEAAGLPLPDSYSYPTLGGGEHIYYLAPEGIEVKSQNPAILPDGSSLPGVDIKAWGGMVVFYGPRLERPLAL